MMARMMFGILVCTLFSVLSSPCLGENPDFEMYDPAYSRFLQESERLREMQLRDPRYAPEQGTYDTDRIYRYSDGDRSLYHNPSIDRETETERMPYDPYYRSHNPYYWQ